MSLNERVSVSVLKNEFLRVAKEIFDAAKNSEIALAKYLKELKIPSAKAEELAKVYYFKGSFKPFNQEFNLTLDSHKPRNELLWWVLHHLTGRFKVYKKDIKPIVIYKEDGNPLSLISWALGEEGFLTLPARPEKKRAHQSHQKGKGKSFSTGCGLFSY